LLSFLPYIIMADDDMAAFLQSLKDGPTDQPLDSTAAPASIVALDGDEEDDDDYDPTALIAPSVDKPTPSAIIQQTGGAKNQTRVKGGFVIEDEDEDDGDVPNTATANGLANGANAAASSDLQRSLTGTPSNANVSLQSTKVEDSSATQDNTSTAVSLNAPAVPTDSRAASSTPLPKPDSPPAAGPSDDQRTASISLPKVRLPQDRIGQLEDRIAEDPRGDVDAWLELINEHRIKNRLDDARNVYTRFFALFPSAVSKFHVDTT
jgi:cleavage stimulation factor subunit 3